MNQRDSLQQQLQPQQQQQPQDADTLLLQFLRGRDAECPRCGYNLRDLSRPECPECRERLALTVGRRRVPLAPLFAAVAPGFFSMIAAAMLLIPMILEGPPPLWPILVDCFGWTSGLVALGLCWRANRFLRLALTTQLLIAAAIWTVHGAVFILLVTLV